MAPSTAMDAIPKLQADGSNAYHWEAALKLYANIHSIGGLLDGSYMVTYPETPHYQTEPTTTSSAFNTPQLLLDAQQRVRAHNKEVTTQYDKDYELYRIYNSRESSLTLAILNTVPRSVWDNVMNLPTVRQKYEAITARYREQGVTEECTIWADFFKLRAQDCPSTANFTDKFKAGLAKLDVIADCKLSNKARVYQFILAINNAYPDYGRDRRADLRRNVTLNVDRMCSELIDEARRDDPIKTINTSIRASGGDNNRSQPLGDNNDANRSATRGRGNRGNGRAQRGRGRGSEGATQRPTNTSPYCKHCDCNHTGGGDNCWYTFPHLATEAWRQRQAQQQGKQQPTSTNAAAINAEGFAFTTVHLSEKVQSLTKETSNFKQRFIIDTGSSDHICNDRSKFQILHDTAPATINTGAGPITAKQVGTIQITVVTSEGVLNKVSFTNVLYAPDMFVSVLSHSKLRAKNLYYHGWDSKLYLMPSQQEIAFTPEIDKIPTLLLANTELEAARAFAFATAATTNPTGVLAPYREITLQELHELFGHADPKALKLLVANTTGLRLTTTQAFSCEACMLSKSKKQISRRSPARSTTFLHRIHIDIVGPVTPEGVNGERYWILYTDDYSRYRWIDFTDCKAAITSKLIQHLDKMETQHHSYWPYAAQYSIDVLNHSVSSAVLDSKTPRQLLFEHMKVANPVPNLCSFRTFGEAGYVHQPVQRRVQSAKFEPRSVKMYFVGREGSRIYLMWDPVTQSIHRTSSVAWPKHDVKAVVQEDTATTKPDQCFYIQDPPPALDPSSFPHHEVSLPEQGSGYVFDGLEAEAQSSFDFDADIDNYNVSYEARKLRSSVHHLSVQYELLKHENEGLKEALQHKKKHRKKGKALDLQQRQEYHGGSVFWSPRKLREARAREAVRERDETEEKLQKARSKKQREEARLQRQDELEERPTKQRMKEIKEAVYKKYKCRDLGPISHYLGLRIRRSRPSRLIEISMESYVDKLVEEYSRQHALPRYTPLDTSVLKLKLRSPTDLATQQQIQNYQKVIGKLLYPATQLRADISFHVAYLARAMSNPTQQHYEYAIQIIDYLKTFKSLVMSYRATSPHARMPITMYLQQLGLTTPTIETKDYNKGG
ncbi:RVT-2 domain containing protein [Pyrenophora tritici-repentis]|nr:RVT-2 domain containing protein [Pyrenophora tritici-repentis]